MSKKAVVLDNSGTLIERHRVVKDLNKNQIINTSSFDIIDNLEEGALVVLQFNSACLKKLNNQTKIHEVISKYNIQFDISYSNCNLSNNEVINIIKNDNAIIKDILDCFNLLKDKVPNMDLCNGSALILDVTNKKIAYTITTAGQLFPESIKTVETLIDNNIEVFIASGDRAGAIKKLTQILNINESHGFSTVDTQGKAEVVSNLQKKGYKVMMVGDGPNDIQAFNNADISVLTIEQLGKVSENMEGTYDYCIDNIKDILNISF